jgi:hypothetical protein
MSCLIQKMIKDKSGKMSLCKVITAKISVGFELWVLSRVVRVSCGRANRYTEIGLSPFYTDSWRKVK